MGSASEGVLDCEYSEWQVRARVFCGEKSVGDISMSINIKSDETCRLADELARLTGETRTVAITAALRERLEREKRERGPDTRAGELQDRAGELQDIGRRCAGLLSDGPSAAAHGDLLYDERGLPA